MKPWEFSPEGPMAYKGRFAGTPGRRGNLSGVGAAFSTATTTRSSVRPVTFTRWTRGVDSAQCSQGVRRFLQSPLAMPPVFERRHRSANPAEGQRVLGQDREPGQPPRQYKVEVLAEAGIMRQSSRPFRYLPLRPQAPTRRLLPPRNRPSCPPTRPGPVRSPGRPV